MEHKKTLVEMYTDRKKATGKIDFRPVKDSNVSSNRANVLISALGAAKSTDLNAISEGAFEDLITHSVHNHLKNIGITQHTKDGLQQLIAQKGSRVPDFKEAKTNIDAKEILAQIEALAGFGHPLAMHKLAMHLKTRNKEKYISLLSKAAVQVALKVDKHQFVKKGVFDTVQPFTYFGHACATEAAQVLIDFAMAINNQEGGMEFDTYTAVSCLLRADKLLGRQLNKADFKGFDSTICLAYVLKKLSQHPEVVKIKISGKGYEHIANLFGIGPHLEDKKIHYSQIRRYNVVLLPAY